MRNLLIAFFILVIATNPILLKHGHAQTNLNVTLQVGDTTITLRGKTSPNATVTITEDNVIVGTVTANSLGNFSKTLDSQDEGLHEFAIYATDDNSTATAVTTVSLSASAFADTEVNNIILSPTVYVTGTNVDQGDVITFSGYGVPNATIRVFISSVTGFETTTTDPDGFWTYELNTSTLDDGEHSVYVVLVTPTNHTSISSAQVTISVDDGSDSEDSDDDDDDDDGDKKKDKKDKDSATIIETVTNIITGSGAQSEEERLFKEILSYFDIDNSGTIELSELDLVLMRWILEAKGKGNLRCDLNFDSKCNIVDFSILLYYIDR